MLQRVMAAGLPLAPAPPLREIRERFLADFARLDERYKAIDDPPTYPLLLSPRLQALREEVERQVVTTELELEAPYGLISGEPFWRPLLVPRRLCCGHGSSYNPQPATARGSGFRESSLMA